MRRTTPGSEQQSEAPRDTHPQGQPQHREEDTQTRWGGRRAGCTRHMYAPTSPCHRHTQCCDATTSAPSQHLGRATPDQPQIPRVQGNLCSLWLKSDGEETELGWPLWGLSQPEGRPGQVASCAQRESLLGAAPEESPDLGGHCQPLPCGAEGGRAARGITGAAVLPEGLTQEQSRASCSQAPEPQDSALPSARAQYRV